MRMSSVCHQEIMQVVDNFFGHQNFHFLINFVPVVLSFQKPFITQTTSSLSFFLAGQAKVARVKMTTRVTEVCRPRFSPCRSTLVRAYTPLTESEGKERLLAVYSLPYRHYIKHHQFVHFPGNQKMNYLGYLLPLWLLLAVCRGQCLLLLLLLLIQNISPFLIGSNPPPDSS